MKANKLLKMSTLAVCLVGCLSFSCKDSELGFVAIQLGEINRIELLNKDAVAFTSMDSSKIGQFLTFLLTASLDTSGQNFKSWNFAKLYNDKGEYYRIEMFGNLFKANGIRFSLNENVLPRFKSIFGLP